MKRARQLTMATKADKSSQSAVKQATAQKREGKGKENAMNFV